MKLPCRFESGEHAVFGVRCFDPALSGEEPLRYVLACSEAVKDGAAAEASGAQAVVDGAGEIGGQVLAWSASGFVEGKICRAGESEGRAAESKAIAAIRTQCLAVKGGRSGVRIVR